MKKGLIITLVSVLIIVAGVGAYVATGHDFSFMNGYIENFKDNLFNIRLKFEQKKAEYEEAHPEEEEPLKPQESIEQQPDEKPEPNKTVSTKDDKKVHLTLNREFELSADPIAVNGAANARYARYMDGILCVLENKVDFYNTQGDKKWTRSIQLSNPVLKVNGNYYFIFEQGAKKLSVYNEKGLVYSVETVENILNGSISSNGECAVITEKEYYKGAVNVYNKSGEEIFSRSFGSENVISCAISSSRKLAVSLLSVRTQAYSKIVLLDVNKTEEEASIEYDNSIVFDLDYSGNRLIAYADDKIIALNSRGNEEWVYEYNNKTLNHYSKDSSDVRLMLFDNNNNAEMSFLTSSGKEKQKISTDVIPDFCDVCDGMVIYNNKRELYLSRLNGEVIAKYTASRDIHKAYFIDSDNIVVIYNQSLEFLHTKKISNNDSKTEEN